MYFFDEAEESLAAVVEVVEPMFDFGGAEGVNIETDVLSVAAIFISFQNTHLIEGGAKVITGEGLVLVEFKAVLIIEVQGPELAEGHGKVDFLGGIEAGEDAMSRLDQGADALWITRELRDGERMTDGRDIRMVHRFVRLGLNCEPNLFIVQEHFVERLD